MIFSTNQNRQIFIANGVTENGAIPTQLGEIAFKTDADANQMYLIQLGHGGLVRSDIVRIPSIMWVHVSASKDMMPPLKKVTLALDQNINQGKVISGQDYVVRINFRQLYGMSDEDIYQKYGAVHATAAMVEDESLFWSEMAYSLVKNFNRLYCPLLDISIADTVIASAQKVNGEITFKDAEGNTIDVTDVTGIDIIEKTQEAEWQLGVKPITPVYFDVIPTTVLYNGDEVTWGTATTEGVDSNLPNGYKIADLEYFCMGERADQYRNVGWPNVIPTRYFADPTQEYYVIDIHYAYQGNCEDIQKSEKTLTIASTNIVDVMELTNMINDPIVIVTEAARTAIEEAENP